MTTKKTFRLKIKASLEPSTFYIPLLNKGGFIIEFQCNEGTTPTVEPLKEID